MYDHIKKTEYPLLLQMHMGHKPRLHKSYLLKIPSSCHSRSEALSLGAHTRDGLEHFAATATADAAFARRATAPASSMDKTSGRDSAGGRALRPFCDTLTAVPVDLKNCR